MKRRGRPRETSRDYAHPHRPRPLDWFNRASALGAQLVDLPARLAPLELEALIAEARARTGLQDFGPAPFDEASFRPALAQLIESIHREAQLHAIGHFIQRARLLDALCTRLRIEALYAAHPEIAEIELRPALVIAGPQRSGTTKLHRLLAADPQIRALRSWEALNPAPLPGEHAAPGQTQSQRRRRRARLAQGALRYMAPDFFAVHPIEYEAPEEEILLMDLAFMTQTPEATMHVPSYASWLEAQDHGPVYAYLRRVLRVLQWQSPGPERPTRWVLKTPHHMEHISQLLAHFPEATVIQTHRDPRETMASFCSMVAHGRGVFSDAVDAPAVGRHWLRKVERMGRAAQRAAQAHPERFVHVHYRDIVDDAPAQLARIYAAAGLRFDDEARARAARLEQSAPQHRYGRHRYALEDFELDEATIEARLGFMRELGRTPAPAPSTMPRPAERQGSTKALGVGHQGPLRATLTGLWDLATGKQKGEDARAPVDPALRLDGRRVLITGANAGLGLATARDLARRGATLVLAGRSGIPETAEQLTRETGNTRISMERVDLADLEAVDALCERLRTRAPFDLVILNAGLMPAQAQRSPQGFELMFAVHVLANRRLMQRLVEDGCLIPAEAGRAMPRVVIVSSEAHRGAEALPLAALGRFEDFGMRQGMKYYGRSKHQLCALAAHFDREMNGRAPWLAVHSLCPGPVATQIARDAPSWLRPVLDPIMRAGFRSPEQAAKAVVYLAISPELEGQSGRYHHMLRPSQIAASAADPEWSAAVWARTGQLIDDAQRA